MKLHRQLLLFSIGLLSAFSVSAQDLLPHKATYKYIKAFSHVAPVNVDPYVFFEERLLLDSQVLDTAYYSVKRRSIKNHGVYMFYDSTDYQLTIFDSVIYFTGEIVISSDSTIDEKRALVFDFTLRQGDTLWYRNESHWDYDRKIESIAWNDSLKSKEYSIGSLGIFDSRFGFREKGLVPIDIIGLETTISTQLVSVCTDTLLYSTTKISHFFVSDLVDNTNFCDSLVFADLIDAYLTSGINDNPSTFEFSTYPNPFTSHLQIDTKEQMRYSIRSLQGQEILSGQTNKTINTAQLAKGVYLLQLESENGIAVKKIIKK